jgi:hypothetical protein
MNRFASLLMLVASSIASGDVHAQDPPPIVYSLDALQGAWWSDCDAPAAEFVISGDEYFGDFEGSYRVKLTGDVLVFNDGFADGHSINVTHLPLEFRILELTDERVVLSPLPGNLFTDDWHLQSCNDTL